MRLQVENARLRAANALLMRQLQGGAVEFEDKDGDGIPDILQEGYRNLPDPIIVAPRQAIEVERIITYNREGHERLYRMGYEDARRAWRAAGRLVEGEE